ncbi:MAG: LysR family transcriptional regulator [Variovorax sp.]|jgi:LysR family transcriptional regulator for bpeEF and oprC|nr:MAG: LysR family transcriptional regulator [Variovorax sp.]
MDQIQAMRIFARVVESGSFTRAADSLALPKGTVTKQIQALEARVRVKLLNRTTRRVTVTADGAAYYERASRLLVDFDDLDASMTDAQAMPQGRLRIDVGSATASLLLIPALSTFHETYPDIQLDIGVSDRVVDLVADGVDCVIRIGEVTDQSLVARRIGHMPFVVVATPAYLQRHGVPVHPHDLERKGHRLVNQFMPGGRRMYPHEFNRDGERIEMTTPYRIAVNETTAHTSAVLAGLGVSQMVTFIAQPHLDSGALVRVLPDWTREPLPVYVVYPPNRHLSAKVRAFVDWAAALFAAHPQLRRS